MRRRNSMIIGLFTLGLFAPALPPVLAEDTPQSTTIRQFTAHSVDSFHYSSGILTFATGDVDGDTDVDIIGADFYGADNSGSKLWFNDGTGAYSETITLPNSINNATDVELIDLDGDADLDLVVGRTEELSELVLLNDGKGNFDTIKEFDDGFTFDTIVADFDGDHDPDILTVNERDPDPFDPHPTDARERLWLNDGDANFSESTRFELGAWAGVQPANLDDDSDVDLVASNTENMTVWLNDGAAHFTAGQPIPPQTGSVEALGDLDSDGDVDILGFPWGADVIAVGLNDGKGTFTFETAPLPGIQGGLLKLGDLDHDNDMDAIRFGGWNEAYTPLINDGKAHFTPAQTFGGATVSEVLLADVNNDTWLDVIAGHNPHVSQEPNAPSVWLNQAATIRGTLYIPIIIK